MNDAKVKAFVARILDECEQEGLTLSEALSLPQQLRFALNDVSVKIHDEVGVNGMRVERQTPGKGSDIHR